ncbi:MAG: FHA domain-containing protein [Bacteroidota bacterium]
MTLDNKKYTVGRAGDFLVGKAFPMVGREHATLEINQGIATITPVKPGNRIFVEGFRVKQKRLEGTEEICLSRPNGFSFYLDHYFQFENGLIVAEKKNFDFTREFDRLKMTYDRLKSEERKIDLSKQIWQIMPLLLLSVPGVITSIFGNEKFGGAMIIIGFLALIATRLIIVPKINQKNTKKNKDLSVAWEEQYICPKCRKPLGKENSWKSLKNQGGHVCGATW